MLFPVALHAIQNGSELLCVEILTNGQTTNSEIVRPRQ